MKFHIALFSFCLVTLFISCKKDNTIDPNRGRSYLHIVSTAQTTDTFQLNFNYFNVSNVVIGNFYFNRNWPMVGYADLEEGGKGDSYGNGKLYLVGMIPSYVQGIPNDTVFDPKAAELVKDEKSTLCFTDSSGLIISAKFKDEYTTPDSGQCAVRFINLHELFATAGFESTNNTNVSQLGVAFPGASSFAVVPSGSYDFIVRDGNNGSTVAGTSGIVLESKGVYTFYFSDDNGTNVIRSFRH